MKAMKTLLSGAVLLSLAACGSKAQQAADQIANGVHAKTAEAYFATGTWKTQCESVGAIAGIVGFGGEKVEYSADASGIKRTTTFFEKNDCVTQTLRIEENGNYTNWTALPNGNYSIDEQWNQVVMTPLSDSGATVLKGIAGIGYCGATDWANGAAKDVTAQTANAVPPCFSKTPRQEFDLIQITGATNNEMHLGLVAPGQDKTSAAARPTQIDQSVTFTK